jgi:hypothetical protein
MLRCASDPSACAAKVGTRQTLRLPTGQLVFNASPPDLSGMVQGVHSDLVALPQALIKGFVFGLAHLDPQARLAGEVAQPYVGFVRVGQARTKGQGAIALQTDCSSWACRASATSRTIMRSSVSLGWRARVSAWSA